MNRISPHALTFVLTLSVAATGCVGAELDLDPESVEQTQQELSLTTVLDTSFGTNGVAISTANTDFRVEAVAVDDEGNVYSAGQSHETYYPYRVSAMIMKHRPDGSPDSSWGIGGVAKKDLFPYSEQSITDLAIDSSGRLLAVVDPSPTGFAVARFSRWGDLDQSWGVRGVARDVPSFGQNTSGTRIAIDSYGRIYVGGHTTISGGKRFLVARYTSWGSIDQSFSGDGWATVDFPESSNEVLADLTTSGSHIIAAGTANVAGQQRLAVARFTSSGSPYFYFGYQGRALTAIPYASDAQASAVAMQGSDIVVAGTAMFSGRERFVVARYDWRGRLDTSFSYDGLATGFTFYGWTNARATSVLVDGEGRIVVGGFVEDGASSNSHLAMMRYLDDGRLDTSFGDSGRIVTDIDSTQTEGIAALALDYAERIIAVGSGVGSGVLRALVTRYHATWSSTGVIVLR